VPAGQRPRETRARGLRPAPARDPRPRKRAAWL